MTTLSPSREEALIDGLLRFPRLILVLFCLTLYVPGLFSMPPLDRDESRFAQASKQMLETGDFIVIRYQDDQRNKKPAGIHWMQAASASLAGGADKAGIWAYRLPSVLGAIAAIVTLFTLMRPLIGGLPAFLGSAFMAATISLIAEANISKTDGVLIFTVVAAQGVLLRAYLAGRNGEAGPLAWPFVLLFWGAVALGILIKGPIQPMVVGLTLVTLAIWDRDAAWLAKLRPVPGALMAAALVMPWGLAVLFETDGRYYREAIGVDFIPKIFRGMESHGAPPGYYMLLGLVTFWPATLYLFPALRRSFSRRHEPVLRFLIAWLVPSWIVFELVVTKLPHYSMPTYPALALMCALGITAWRDQASGETPGPILARLSLAIWTLVAGLFAVAVIVLPLVFAEGLIPLAVAGAVVILALTAMTLAARFRGTLVTASVLALMTASAISISALEITGPRLTDLDLSRRLAAAVERHASVPAPPVGSSGYAEPSLVFLVGTDTRLQPGEASARMLAETPRALVIIESREADAFATEAARLAIKPRALETIDGHAYSNGRDVSLTLYDLPDDASAGAAPPSVEEQ